MLKHLLQPAHGQFAGQHQTWCHRPVHFAEVRWQRHAKPPTSSSVTTHDGPRQRQLSCTQGPTDPSDFVIVAIGTTCNFCMAIVKEHNFRWRPNHNLKCQSCCKGCRGFQFSETKDRNLAKQRPISWPYTRVHAPLLPVAVQFQRCFTSALSISAQLCGKIPRAFLHMVSVQSKNLPRHGSAWLGQELAQPQSRLVEEPPSLARAVDYETNIPRIIPNPPPPPPTIVTSLA